MARNVFVSYATRDRARIGPLLDRLRRQRVISADDNVFVDNASFAEGDDFRGAARAAIKDADTVLVLWSPAAAESKWVNYELAMADALGKHLVVVQSKGEAAELPIDTRSIELLEVSGA